MGWLRVITTAVGFAPLLTGLLSRDKEKEMNLSSFFTMITMMLAVAILSILLLIGALYILYTLLVYFEVERVFALIITWVVGLAVTGVLLAIINRLRKRKAPPVPEKKTYIERLLSGVEKHSGTVADSARKLNTIMDNSAEAKKTLGWFRKK